MVQISDEGKGKRNRSESLVAQIYHLIHRAMSSFTVKIGFFIFLQSIILSLLIIFFFYSESKKILIHDMNTHLTNVANLGVLTFTNDDLKLIRGLKDIIDQHSPLILSNATNKYLNPKYRKNDKDQSLPALESTKYQNYPAYQKIVQLLRKIRESSRARPDFHQKYFAQDVKDSDDQPMISYAYLIIPPPKQAKLPVVIDIADSSYEYIPKKGATPKDLEPSFGTFYRMEPAYQRALSGKAATKSDWITDKWGTWFTIAAPVFDENRQVIAALAFDYDVNDSRNFLHAIFRWAQFFIILSILLSIVFAVFISRQLSKPIELLLNAAQKISQHDFTARAEIHSEDQIGMFARVFNNMTTEIQQYSTNLENLVQSYGRFVPMEFLKLLDLPSILDVKLGDQVEKTMAVLFCDIRSFTSITEHMSPKEAIQYLNEYLLIAAPVIREHHGFVDKFIGDSIMALFPRGATDAVNGSIALLHKISEYNQGTPHQSNPIRLALGIHAGKLMIGTVGEEERLEGTVISDVVNFAARLESTAKLLGVVSLMSEDAKKSLAADISFEFRYLGKMKAKGKTVSIGIYEILGALPEKEKQVKIKTRSLFEKAIHQFEKGQTQKARVLFKEILEKNPNDSVARIYHEVLTTPNSPYTQYFG
ncbi:MAG: HAMP domain-containing protein [Tatlockia sp.]|nr:HAMP domain-containing protein [Tatlockia sp.]